MTTYMLHGKTTGQAKHIAGQLVREHGLNASAGMRHGSLAPDLTVTSDLPDLDTLVRRYAPNAVRMPGSA